MNEEFPRGLHFPFERTVMNEFFFVFITREFRESVLARESGKWKQAVSVSNPEVFIVNTRQSFTWQIACSREDVRDEFLYLHG